MSDKSKKLERTTNSSTGEVQHFRKLNNRHAKVLKNGRNAVFNFKKNLRGNWELDSNSSGTVSYRRI